MAVVVACGGLGAASQGRAALRAQTSLEQVSRCGKTKHGRSPAANEWIADDCEMEFQRAGASLDGQMCSCSRCDEEEVRDPKVWFGLSTTCTLTTGSPLNVLRIRLISDLCSTTMHLARMLS